MCVWSVAVQRYMHITPSPLQLRKEGGSYDTWEDGAPDGTDPRISKWYTSDRRVVAWMVGCHTLRKVAPR